jgi:exonuclease SbcD
LPLIVFTADNHLGKYYARMNFDQLIRRRLRIRKAWERTVDYALDQGAALYLHGGDLFDSANPHPAELNHALAGFRRLRQGGIHVVAMPGNHDTPRQLAGRIIPQRFLSLLGDDERWHRQGSSGPGRMCVAAEPGRLAWFSFDLDGVRLAVGALAPDPRYRPGQDPLASVDFEAGRPDADLTLLLFHYAVQGVIHPEANEPIIPRDALAGLPVDVILAGHIHLEDELKLGRVHVLFSGPTERHNFGELDLEPGFLALEVTGNGWKWQREKVAAQPMKRIFVSAGDLPADTPTFHLASLVRAASDKDQILQCVLSGNLERQTYHKLDLAQVWRIGQDLNFWFDLDRSGFRVADPQRGDRPAGLERLGLKSEITRLADQRIEAADGTEQALWESARDLVLAKLEE